MGSAEEVSEEEEIPKIDTEEIEENELGEGGVDLFTEFQRRYENFSIKDLTKSGVKGQVSEAREDFLSCLRDIGKRHLDRKHQLLGQWLALHKVQTEFEKTEFYQLSLTPQGEGLQEEFSPISIMRTLQVWHNR